MNKSAVKAGKGQRVDASILRYSKVKWVFRLLLLHVTVHRRLGVQQVKRTADSLGTARYEIPHLLLQAKMVLNYDESFGQYEAFAISTENFIYTFVEAIMSPEYLRSLRTGSPVHDTMEMLRSKPFNIVDRDTWRNFLKSPMALGRHLVNHPEYSFPMRKYRADS